MKTLIHGLKLGGGGGMKTPARRPAAALKTLAALTLLAALAALILHAALPAGASSHFTDYDTDDDGLIEIDTIAELQGIRLDPDGNGFIPTGNDRANYNAAFPNRQTVASRNSTSTRMGCPARCIGYELMANLDFATATTSLRNWTVGGNYSGILEGNGYTIANLSMNVTSGFTIGFISELSGVVRNLGLVNPSITTSGGRIGIVAGYNYGAINASWVSGGSVTYTQPEGVSIGGLVGVNDLIGAISASYSTASVNIANNIDGEGAVGGLVGVNNGRINASYAAGRVTGTTTATTTSPAFGGLVGDAVFEVVTENDLNQIVANSVITDSYCTAAGQAAVCIGDPASVDRPDIPTSTAAQLQTPTTYTGIYENWNVDVDGDTFPDNPWNFGATSAYPTIRPLAQRAADYDLDNDNLIDVDTLHKLNAIRHDLNGDGLPESTGDYVAYAGVFPGGNFDINRGPRMGCATFCIGYELAAGLDFAADGVAVTSTDAYPNWMPIGGVGAGYSGVFDGNGRTIARLTVNRTSADAGLFGRVAPRGVIRNVGMVDADIRGRRGRPGLRASGGRQRRHGSRQLRLGRHGHPHRRQRAGRRTGGPGQFRRDPGRLLHRRGGRRRSCGRQCRRAGRQHRLPGFRNRRHPRQLRRRRGVRRRRRQLPDRRAGGAIRPRRRRHCQQLLRHHGQRVAVLRRRRRRRQQS